MRTAAMTTVAMTNEELLAENERLRLRLEEHEATIEAIRSGLVDAIVVNSPQDKVYTLEGADRPYRQLVEAMQQGVAIVNREGSVLYCNPYLAHLFHLPEEKVIGAAVDALLAGTREVAWPELVQKSENAPAPVEFLLRRHDGSEVPVAVVLSILPARQFSLLVTDLSQQKQYEELLVSKEALQRSE